MIEIVLFFLVMALLLYLPFIIAALIVTAFEKATAKWRGSDHD